MNPNLPAAQSRQKPKLLDRVRASIRTGHNAFLTHLAAVNRVAACIQNQTLSAVLLLYRRVLRKDVGQLGGHVRGGTPLKLLVAFTVEKAQPGLMRLWGNGPAGGLRILHKTIDTTL